jgi:hypothetical protein
MSVWMKRASTTDQAIGAHVNDSNEARFIRQSDGNTAFFVGVGSNNVGYFADPVTNGNWGHFVVVFDGSQGTNAGRLKIYANGTNQTLTFGGTIPASIGTGGQLGAWRIGWAKVWSTGDFDEMHIYDRVLTSGEVTTLYNSGAGRTYPTLAAGVLTEDSHTHETVTLSWTQPTLGTGNYISMLEFSLAGANSWSPAFSTTDNPGTVNPIDDGITPSTAYDFRVQYSDDVESGVYSNIVTVTTDAAPGGSIIPLLMHRLRLMHTAIPARYRGQFLTLAP